MNSPPSPSEDYFSTSTIPIDEQFASTSVSPPTQGQINSSSPPKSTYKIAGPSSLTLQLQRHSNPSSTQPSREVSPTRPDPKMTIPEMMATIPSASSGEHTPATSGGASREHQKAPQHPSRIHLSPVLPTDTTPLLTNDSLPTYMGAHPSGADSVPRPDHRRTKSLGKRFRLAVGSGLTNAKLASKPNFWNSLLRRSFLALPAVFLGLLLNVLDGVSYGMILFPAGKIFSGFGPMGVSMFFVTYVPHGT
jgi:SulP family sulfate permease